MVELVTAEILDEFLAPLLWKNLVMSFVIAFLGGTALQCQKFLVQTRDICRKKIAKTRWHSPYSSKGTQK